MNKALCLNCEKEVEYRVEIIKAQYKTKKGIIRYDMKRAYCPICGEDVWVEKIDEENAEAPFKVKE